VRAWCNKHGITLVTGVPYHSQAQGLVETRHRTIAAALIATLGGKAPRAWWEGMLLARLETVINNTYCEGVRGTPYWVMYGREARTPLSAQLDWTNPNYGGEAVGEPSLTYDDIHNLIAEHHAAIGAVQQRASMATSLAQAETKAKWDASHTAAKYKAGDTVLLYRTAPNRLTSHLTGPYHITAVSSDGNFVSLEHFLGSAPGVREPERVHVSRLRPFNDVTASAAELTEYHLDVGSWVAEAVLGHRQLQDGSYEFQMRWHGTDKITWTIDTDVDKLTLVKEYCIANSVPLPGSAPRRRDGLTHAAHEGVARGGGKARRGARRGGK
jgi:hypothetical protein